ncbi:MAG TPA: type II toxin-antitoxin system RelE/ParE family toxin [Telluria sp.]|nr:type II toxin-antitoxin system RelE/ParE family toxin [Telluria sp.]
MRVQWASKALSDLRRLHEFLAPTNKVAAARVVKSLSAAAGGLSANPRIGELLDEFAPGEVRRLLVGHDEMRYEIIGFRPGRVALAAHPRSALIRASRLLRKLSAGCYFSRKLARFFAVS